MCRMLFVHAPTYKASEEILRGFRLQAETCQPEPDGSPRHNRGGWGLVAVAQGELRFLARRPTNAAEDERWERAMETLRHAPKGASFMAHLRSCVAGSEALDDTHPFQADGWAFMHNGTIFGDIDEPLTTYQGSTDTERFFVKFRKHLRVQGNVRAAMRRTVQEIESVATYTSLSCVVTDGTTVYAYRRIGSDPRGKYDFDQLSYRSQLGWGRIGKATVLAQETTNLPEIEGWTELGDDELMTWQPGSDPKVEPLGLLTKATASS